MWNKKLKIILQVLLLVALITYLVFALFKTDDQSKITVCSQIEITVKDSAQFDYITSSNVKMLLKSAKMYPQGERISRIDCKAIEAVLLRQPYINTANCYKTPNGKVIIEATQKKPIVRIMSNNGEDYYLDHNGFVLSSKGHPADIVIATGNIDRKLAKKEILELANIIQEDNFWDCQIEQINVTANREIQLIPRVGDHIVLLGKGENLEEKLTRLKQFYKKILGKVGWDRYSMINLEFDNQIICTNKE
ncbi:MAG: cell division protein FtsQ [Bacteroidaceae bacterium]|nr:cell division protein FtsQ [Bacteroidaceae bacterium]